LTWSASGDDVFIGDIVFTEGGSDNDGGQVDGDISVSTQGGDTALIVGEAILNNNVLANILQFEECG